jgi:ribosome maturation factor RimP
MELIDKIRELAQSAITDPSLFLVEVIFSGKQGPTKKVLIIVDGDNGVTIDHCANISRTVSAAMDEMNLVDDKYMLEVSTPGLDHPLKLKRQYRKNIGRSLKVHLNDKSIVQGKMTVADDEKIVIDQEIKEGKKIVLRTREIMYSQIERAFVLVSFK